MIFAFLNCKIKICEQIFYPNSLLYKNHSQEVHLIRILEYGSNYKQTLYRINFFVVRNFTKIILK